MVEVLVLGPVEARHDETPIPLKSPTHRLILAVLAASRPYAVESHRLVEALWDDPPRTAEKSLLSHISRIRRRLGATSVERVGSGYRLQAATDSERFEASLGNLAEEPPERAAARIDDALALWRGRPFGDLGDHRFLLAARDRLDAQRTEARLIRARLLARAGDPARAVVLLDALTADEPLHEGAWAELLTALTRTGRIADALRAARRARSALGDVGLEPSPALAAAEALAVGTASSPGAERAPSASATAPPLPRPLSSLVGRVGEIEEVAGLLTRHHCVTLVGPGGVGKTRVALEAARRREGLPKDRWFCDLAAVSEPNDVAAAVAAAVGASLAAPIEQRLVDFGTVRSGLLLLDTCEHLVDAVAALLANWLPRCPSISVLATSRTRLGIDGERVFDVAPLDVTSAFQLFRERAAAAGADTEARDDDAVREVCRRLDGLPLAIEMAAVRARAIAVRELAVRLDRRFELLRDERRPARHRTLTELVAWSYEALHGDQRRAFELLSVFNGEFELANAEAVVGACLGSDQDVAILLAALCDRSLLARTSSGPTRYRMLDTIRADAAARLAAFGADDDATRAHLTHYTERAAVIGHGLEGPEEAAWAARAEDDLPNLRAAHHAAIERGFVEPALAIPARLFHLVFTGLRADVAGWAGRAIAMAESGDLPDLPIAHAVAALGQTQADRLDDAQRAAETALRLAGEQASSRFALVVLGLVGVYQGALEQAADHTAAAHAAAMTANDRYTASVAAMLAGLARTFAGQPDAARRWLAESRRNAELLGAPTLLANVEYAEGELYIDSDPDRALASFEAAIARSRRAGGSRTLGAALLSATTVRARHGDPQTALAGFATTIRHWLDRGDWMHVWTTLRNLAVLLARVGDDEAAASLLGVVASRAGGIYGTESIRLDETARTLRDRLGPDVYQRAVAAGRGMPPSDAVRLAFDRVDSVGG